MGEPWANHFNEMKFLIIDVLNELAENQEDHVETFNLAVEGYKKMALEQLEDRIDAIKNNRHFDLGFKLPVPVDHSSDYQRAIKMLTMSASAGETHVILTEYQVAQYIMDEWDWSPLVTASNSFYLEGGQ